jgi:hypothetical protein
MNGNDNKATSNEKHAGRTRGDRADGNAAYEAHMTRADGTPVTVYANREFEVVSVESR